jgi:hypothetical protein
MSNVMTHKRLVSAFTKAGCTVTKMEGRTGNPGYVAKNPKSGEQVHWYTQPNFVHVKGGESYYDAENPVATYVCWANPESDSQRDLCMDSFYHTIKSAVQAIA